ncbi:MAG: hypothetical protein COT81_04760 [Candidatus Buchananbacteria bacterium CG10_big_fil_rev_8_21_14_0_10_42_9]|uniref:Carrier domain-containing protein n=1 Tax=Candidatus Buchananbacteria bacterium CG10_big_fil_rev_8_21_14_0_10_42_9 TaxID=1974526 RepID=A0A2H0W099_9BACT|nr:MAG: hypothetical protein COT81_04760 [Candidatus Buchananbacteria bacterium CG10_big_fil_rev_8_21_14_0_10_42_9]
MEQELLDYINNHIIKDSSHLVDLKTDLFKGRYIDSMNILYLIGFVEKKLGRKLSNDEILMSNFASVNAIIKKFFNE